MRKIIILFCLISFAGFAQKNEFIIIKHIGEQNTSVDPVTVVLSGSKQTKEIDKQVKFLGKYKPSRDERVILDTSYFRSFGKEVFNYADSARAKKPVGLPDFGAFKISYFKNDKIVKSYSFYSERESVQFFNHVFSMIPVTDNKNVIKLQFLMCLKLTELHYHKSACEEYNWWKK